MDTSGSYATPYNSQDECESAASQWPANTGSCALQPQGCIHYALRHDAEVIAKHEAQRKQEEAARTEQ
ncbi:hypothetical protein HMPREF3227_00832 [Corynebacterium sp. CMW7794]|nr:hypothetical protein HMPREF0307_00821 [Corynebacterium sp. DNF00584]KXI18921.1 hypothetical protein HMPREF3227_00832 [Corynebacterium sp. CMW7794]